jgi:hypothetical protein
VNLTNILKCFIIKVSLLIGQTSVCNTVDIKMSLSLFSSYLFRSKVAPCLSHGAFSTTTSHHCSCPQLLKLNSSELLSIWAIKPWNRVRSDLATGNETKHSRSGGTAFPLQTVQSAWPGNAAQKFVSVPHHIVCKVRSFSVFQEAAVSLAFRRYQVKCCDHRLIEVHRCGVQFLQVNAGYYVINRPPNLCRVPFFSFCTSIVSR